MADDETLKLLRNIGASQQISDKDLKTIQQGITACGALDAAKERSRIHAEKARKLIKQVKMTDETKEFFNSLLTFVTTSLDWYK